MFVGKLSPIVSVEGSITLHHFKRRVLHQIDLLYRFEVTVDTYLIVLIGKKLCYEAINL